MRCPVDLSQVFVLLGSGTGMTPCSRVRGRERPEKARDMWYVADGVVHAHGAGTVQMADGSAPGLAEVLDMKAFGSNT